MTEILILYILIKYDATIYKIKKLIEEKFYTITSPSLGAINPALKKLETLSCVEFTSSMTEGGLLSKNYKITAFGVKYLKNLLTSFKFKNKAHTIDSVSMLVSLSDVLDEEEKKEVFKNCSNHLILLKNDIENSLKNPYIVFSEDQKKVLKANFKMIDGLLEVVQ